MEDANVDAVSESLISVANSAIIKLGELTEALESVLENTNKLKQSLQEIDAAENRLSAKTLEPDKPLVFEPVPNPIHTPKIMPAYLMDVFKQTRPPTSAGYIYEATVDRLACAFFTVYLPITHQFLLQPQHTFRALAPNDVVALENEWSIVGAVGDGSSRMAAFNPVDDSEELSFSFLASPREPPSATDQGSSGELHLGGEDSSFELSGIDPRGAHGMPLVSTPRAENASTLPRAARFDQLNRLVLLAKEGLQRPDLSVMFQNVKGGPGVPETTIVMCENKLKDGPAAIKQLKRYAEKYGRDTPRMRFFAFRLGRRGLEVAMFRFAAATTELVPILDAANHDEDGRYSVYAEFVHTTMCELAAEVQSELWGFQWAYEEA
ncbi:hypothetical protein MSAN_00568500 [Mycena sanguinolenta]|uniref:Uncharacterized protein n=1 Tax=Mycena sanguinolenta TaxID=230812 RepID=A0A8H6ZC44_9AGAR|nr:hypothetical protein MSAN_00568500 [Mycena sanguinolenta]